MKFGYIYKITYLDERSHLFNHFYYGEHAYSEGESLLDPNGPNYYHGSSARAKKEYWPFYSKHNKEIICWCDTPEELKEKESEYISNNIDDPLCINVVISNKLSPKVYTNTTMKERISNSLKQYYNDHPEALDHMSEIRKGKDTWMKGKKHSDETKKKMSDVNKGRTPWNKGKKGIQVAWNKGLPKEQQPAFGKSKKGIKWSEEAKERNKGKESNFKGHKQTEKAIQAVILAHKGVPLSDETKKKIGNSLRGRKNGPLSDEHKRKISEAKKGKTPWNKGLKLK